MDPRYMSRKIRRFETFDIFAHVSGVREWGERSWCRPLLTLTKWRDVAPHRCTWRRRPADAGCRDTGVSVSDRSTHCASDGRRRTLQSCRRDGKGHHRATTDILLLSRRFGVVRPLPGQKGQCQKVSAVYLRFHLTEKSTPLSKVFQRGTGFHM